MSERQRESTGFMIRQRAFLKLYLITEIEKGKSYGFQLQDILLAKFAPFAFEPTLPEIYRALHDLAEDDILHKGEEKVEGAKYKKIGVYTIKDKEKARAYKKLVKMDLERCDGLLRQAVYDNFA